jgi:hypothetical protein
MSWFQNALLGSGSIVGTDPMILASEPGRVRSVSTEGRRGSAIVEHDQLGDTGRTLAAFDFDDHVIADPQAVGRDVLYFRNAGPAPDP